MNKERIVLLLMVVMCLLLAACTPAEAPSISETGSGQPEAADPAGTTSDDGIPAAGAEISGFTFQGMDPYDPLNAEILYFTHKQSGAQLCYIKNDDTNRAFSIAYRTPHVDETDANHIFEHAILSGSEKYPSKNLFFDLAGKTYSTNVNAYTYIPFTMYPVASLSEEQLLLMADAYLSCMVSPDLLSNEHIFRREAVRYMLYDVDEPISMGGTVFSEDMGYMTDIGSEAVRNLMHGLYPGEYAANFNGRAHINYRDLTYEHVVETYERCYNFDNALILLYGDLDYRNFLEFIHAKYLSKAENRGVDLSAYDDPVTEPGYVEEIVDAPAYEGDSTENASVIYYGMDLEGLDWETLAQYELFAKILDSDSSIFHENLKKAGLTADAFTTVILDCEKPVFCFGMEKADPGDAASFKTVVDNVLANVAENGLDDTLVETVLKTKTLGDYTMMEDMYIATDTIFPAICMKWAQTGGMDILAEKEAAFSSMQQTLIRELAAALQNVSRSAMITTVPKPGLAEQLVAKQEAYLTKMKAAMTPEELEQMVKDTQEFDAWNASEQSNNDIVIPVADLPELEDLAEFTREEAEGAVYYSAASEIEQISRHRLYFDSSAVAQEDLHYITLYSILLEELAAGNYSKVEKDNLMAQYLYDFSAEVIYPETGENNYPMLRIEWNCMADDYETSLRLLLDIMGQLRMDDKDEMTRVLDKWLPALDWSRSDPLDLGELIAPAGIDVDGQYWEYMNGQRFYEFVGRLRERLYTDPGAMEDIAGKLQLIQGLILHKDRLTVMNVAPQDKLKQISGISRQELGELPSIPAAEVDYELPEYPDRIAVIMEASNYCTYSLSDTTLIDDLSGSFFPFANALSDRYVIPKIRFQGLAYSAGMGGSRDLKTVFTFTYSDPNVADTVAVIDGEADALAAMELTQEALDGYIVNAYSHVTEPTGKLGRYLDAMQADLSGADVENGRRLAAEIRTATVEDKEQAVEVLRRLLENQHLVTLGNAQLIREEADTFDQIYDYRGPLD